MDSLNPIFLQASFESTKQPAFGLPVGGFAALVPAAAKTADVEVMLCVFITIWFFFVLNARV